MVNRIGKSLRSALAWGVSLALVLAAASVLPAHAQNGHWLTGYYAIYDQNGVMTPSQVDMTKLTHVIYWGVEPTSTGGLNTTKYVSASTFASGATSLVSAAHAAGAKALIGIGGDLSDGYSLSFNEATTPANLSAFVSAIVQLMQQYNFDGVDINWEQIGYYSGDNTQFPAFIKALRAQLNTLTPKPLLTMSPETKGNGGRPDLIGPMYQDFDQINIQTYLMSGNWCGWETWFNSPMSNNGQTFVLEPDEQLPSITAAVADYTSAGVPIGELGMGIQFGGLTWNGGAGTSTGGATKPLQTWTNDASAIYCSETNPSAPTLGYPLYTALAPLASGAPANGYTVNYDSVADQSWLSYDPSGTGSTNESKDKFIAYDSPDSIAKKGTDLSGGTGLGGTMGGAMLFELSGDYFPAAATGEQHPLLDAANAMESLLPGQVTGLSIAPGTGTAALKWTAAPFATKYQVYYSTTSGTAGTLSGTVSAARATVSDLTAGELYYFQVWPANAFGVAKGGIATGSATIGGLTVPTITWNPSPSTIGYGVPLTNAELDATASVAGTFTYSPTVGAVLPVGANTVTASFTPSVSGYATATKTATITVTSETLSASDSFGLVNVGSWSDAHAITLIHKGTVASGFSTRTLTLGSAGLDFQGDSSSCTYEAANSQETCVVTLTFSPTVPGQRKGAVVMLLNGAPVATAYIQGTGNGAQIGFDPGTPSAYSIPSQIDPMAVAVDGAGNIYTFDYLGKKVLKFTPAGAYSTYLGPLPVEVAAMAFDGAGNLFLAEPTLVAKATQELAVSTFASGFTPAPKGVAVGSGGYVYVANTLANSVLKYTPAGTVSTVIASTTLIAGKKLNLPAGVATDGSGNLYVADSGNNRILKVPSSGSASVLLSGGVTSPEEIAVDGVGNVYVADPDNRRIVEITHSGVHVTVVSGTVLGYTLAPTAIAVDGAGNLYVAEYAHERVLKFARSSPPSLSFAATGVGSTSSDSPRSITVENTGNQSLTFPVPASGTNAGITTEFTLGSATTCPVLKTTSSRASLAAGSSCLYSVDFVPAAAGSISGRLTLTDNAPNAIHGKQTIALSGTGVNTTATVTLSGLADTYTGSPIPAKVTTSPAGLAVTITYGGSTTAPTKAGSYAVVATVTQAGYTGSASGTEAISMATPHIGWPAPAAVTAPYTLGATQLDATATNGALTVAGGFVYTPASGTVLQAGTYTLKAQFTPTDTADYNAPALAEQTFVVNAAAAPSRVVWVPDYYGQLLQVRVGTGASSIAITVSLPSSCNPNAVAVNSNKAYVVCNADEGGTDEILVYNASTIRSAAAGALSISPTQTITSAQFNSLIGIAFDASNDLWLASYGNNQVDEITAAALATATPAVTASLIDSPGSPVALAFDANGSLWVTGQYNGGILLNFPPSQFGTGENANPDYCLATVNVGSGCQYVTGVFFGTEGLAVFNGDVWVANNSTGAAGNVPGRELIDLKYSGGSAAALGTLTVNATYGSSSNATLSPLVCPGGLFAGSVHLWVNDESFGETNPQCGAAGDVASKTGAVFDFTAVQLAAQPVAGSTTELAYQSITGRPGFGGIFVENDQ